MAFGIVVKDAEGQSETAVRIPQIVAGYRDRSDRARRSRADKNRENWDLFWGRQDFSYKQKYQSKEFLPDLPIAVEQIAGVIERALGDFSDWARVEPLTGLYDEPLQSYLLDPASLWKLLLHCLSRLYVPGNQAETAYGFPTLMADAVKLGIMEAVITLKVYGVTIEEPRFRLERVVTDQVMQHEGYYISYPSVSQVVQQVMAKRFRLCIDPVPWEDFFPDPSGLKLYDIHEVTRNIAELKANPDYDPDVVELLEANLMRDAEQEMDRRRRSGQDETGLDDLLKVRVRECWGDIMDEQDGTILGRNRLVTTAGDRYLLRPDVPNPLWHGKSPFVSAPLIRVPLSVVHKALLDHAGPMARLMNEVMNLMIDGGMAATWGIRQVRPDLMAHPEEISDGIPQGYTAVLRPHVPSDAKFLERVDAGEMPEYTAQVFARIEKSFQLGLATPDLKMGMLPPRQVKATEVVEAMNASNSLFEAMVARLDGSLITPVLELAWGTIWQHLDDFSTPELVEILGVRRAFLLQRMSPAERFVRMAQSVRLKVTGLRALLGLAQDYQKYIVLTQTLMQNPALAAAYDQKYSVAKLLAEVMKSVRIDPTRLEKGPGEGAELNPALLAGAGGAGSAGSPIAPGGAGAIEQSMAPPNPTGNRGPQAP